MATDICGLHRGPDGRIYGATIISMHIFRFDPVSRDLEDLGKVGWGGGEVYDVIACGGKVYMGSYGGGYFAAYDPDKPWNPRPGDGGEHPEANPRNFGPLGPEMNRPFEYTVGPDGRIYIACRANYHVPGGGLARFDPETEEKKVFRDEDQSVQSVASDETWVYGGTSIRGGRGCVETTTEARLFMFCPRAGAPRLRVHPRVGGDRRGQPRLQSVHRPGLRLHRHGRPLRLQPRTAAGDGPLEPG